MKKLLFLCVIILSLFLTACSDSKSNQMTEQEKIDMKIHQELTSGHALDGVKTEEPPAVPDNSF